jgi:hypothetical protein
MFVDGRQYSCVMQKEAVKVLPNCSGGSKERVAWSLSL